MKFEEMILLVMLVVLPVTSGDCPRQCYCSKYKTRCFLAKLYRLPPDIAPTTEQLMIERDHITELTEAINRLTMLSDIQLIYTNTSMIAQTAFHRMDQLRTIIISHNRIKEIAPGTFVGLHQLSKIDLSHNSIQVLYGHMFEGLVALRYLDLSHNTISSLPIDLFEGIGSSCVIANGRLDLSDNQITHIENGTFQNMCAFTELDLSENNLSMMLEGTFEGLRRLKTLDLINCNITQLSADTFSGLHNLDSLNLDGNLFTSFGDAEQSTVVSVRYLHLNSGQLNAIQNHTLKNFTLLQKLELYNNAIQNLSCGAFSKLQSLLILDLSSNKLSQLTTCVFEGLVSVKTLSVSNNQISVLHNKAFRHLDNLQILDLSFNNLTVLSDNVFSNLKHLRILYLSNSQIHKMQSNSFENLMTLRSLVLAGNQLTELQVNVFRNVTSLNYLDLTYNPNLTISPGTFSQIGTMLGLGLQVSSDNTTKLGTLLRDLMKGITNIQHLKLSGIKTSLESDEFRGFQFETLDLSGNIITVLLKDNFKELTMLKSLYLHSSSIQEIKVAAFSQLKHLNELKLSDNFLKSLEPGIFAGLRSLEKLEMNNNRITLVRRGVFGSMCVNKESLNKCINTRLESRHASSCKASPSLVELKHLFLRNNTISHIDPHVFIHNNKLQTLDLSDNPITTIDFLLIPSLEILFLSSCNISTVPTHNLSCISNLLELHLDRNNLETLEVEALKPLNKLQYIDISNNPFVCDCKFEETILLIRRIRHEEAIQCVNGDAPWHSLLPEMHCYASSTEQSDRSTFSMKNILLLKQIEPMILFIIFVVGIGGNSFIVFLFARHSELRTIYNAHLLNLAVCDLMFLIMNIPLSYWNLYSKTWELGLEACKVFMSVRDLATAAAIYSMIHWSFQRYNAIIPSFGLENLISERKLMWLCILVVWGISLGAAFPVLLSATVKFKCLYSMPDTGFIEQTWNIHLVTLCIIPLLVVVVLNARVSLHLTKSAQDCNDETQAKTRVRISNALWVETTIFCISYFPNSLMRVLFAWSIVDKENVSETVIVMCFISFCLFFISSCFNPVALLWMSVKFREVSLSHFECCRRRNFRFMSTGERLNRFAQTCRLWLRRSSNEDIQLESRRTHV